MMELGNEYLIEELMTLLLVCFAPAISWMIGGLIPLTPARSSLTVLRQEMKEPYWWNLAPKDWDAVDLEGNYVNPDRKVDATTGIGEPYVNPVKWRRPAVHPWINTPRWHQHIEVILDEKAHPQWACQVARMVIFGKWEAGEKKIAESAEWSWVYATQVLGARFVTGEATILADKYYGPKYTNRFLGNNPALGINEIATAAPIDPHVEDGE